MFTCLYFFNTKTATLKKIIIEKIISAFGNNVKPYHAKHIFWTALLPSVKKKKKKKDK